MSWNDFYQRRDALDRVIEGGELVVPDMFNGPTEVLLALQHRWSLQLAGRVELASHTGDQGDDEGDDEAGDQGDDQGDDRVDAVGAAWREAAATNPNLRALLDRYANHPALRAVTKAEHRMLANAAGLTEPGDGPAEQATIGAAFVALLRDKRRSPVARLRRKLVLSS